MSAPPAIAAKAAPQKLRINCSSCGTLCEVQIPAMDPNRKKPIRFQIKCPKCHTLNEMRAAPPAPDEPPAGAAAATGAPPPGAPASAGQKRKADEPPLPPLAGSKKAAKEDASSSGASNGAKAAKSKAGEHPAPPAKPRPPEPKPKASKPAAAPRAPAPKAAATTSPRPGGRGGGRGGRSAGGRAGARGGAPFGGGGRGGSGAGPSSSGGGRGGVTADELDEFVIEEASERLPSKSEGKARVKSVPTGKLLTVGAKPHVHAISAYERAFPSLSVGAPASCELAYAQALARPRWRENDEVEVAFKGKGFEGSWAAAVVVKPDGKKHVLVRYLEFVDNDGTPLVEQGASLTRSPSPALSLALPTSPRSALPVPPATAPTLTRAHPRRVRRVAAVPIERLRLPPPPTPTEWVPALGEPVEGLWNDCWWEGNAREFHVHKGLLFQYDRWQYVCHVPPPPHVVPMPAHARAAGRA